MTIRYVYRGGSWGNGSGRCRSANRPRNSPDIRHNGLGFRVLHSSKEEAKYRVSRGGSWGGYSGSCRSADRRRDSPDGRSFYLGFRIIKENKHGE